MPFSKHVVDSGLMEAMRAAFHRVCEVLKLDCDTDDRLTEIVVTKIVELAKAGERDPERLSNAVLAEIKATQGNRGADAPGVGSESEGAPAAAARAGPSPLSG